MVTLFWKKTKLNYTIPIRTSPKTMGFEGTESKKKGKMKIRAKKQW